MAPSSSSGRTSPTAPHSPFFAAVTGGGSSPPLNPAGAPAGPCSPGARPRAAQGRRCALSCVRGAGRPAGRYAAGGNRRAVSPLRRRRCTPRRPLLHARVRGAPGRCPRCSPTPKPLLGEGSARRPRDQALSFLFFSLKKKPPLCQRLGRCVAADPLAVAQLSPELRDAPEVVAAVAATVGCGVKALGPASHAVKVT